MTNAITQMLDRLAEIQAQLEVLRMDKAYAIEAAIPPAVRDELAAIEDEYAVTIDGAQANAAELEAQIKAAVIEHGETVKTEHLQAVWTKGRITWDAKSLDGYAVAHPELFAFRKEGEPSVSIRRR
jgi:hypothetical protein